MSDLSVVMRGNHCFLKFYELVRMDTDGPELILEKLVDFERRNPNLRISNWRPEIHPSFGWPCICYGLWVDHEPRKEEPKDCDFDALERALGQD